MASATTDRHLLFGLLALQNGLINQGQLILAFQAWTLDKSRSLADHLEARGDLSGAKRAALEALAAVHLEAHGGDVDKSLAAVAPNRSIRASLTGLGEPEMSDTLARIAGGKDGEVAEPDHDRTTSYAVGTATSDGQRFRILRPHARGGLGAVFVALDAELNREVALKQILDHHADDPVSRRRFLIEAEITGGLEHPGIVPVYGLGTFAGGRPYYAMRFIKGDSLKDAIKRFHAPDAKIGRQNRELDLRRLLRRFLDVCNAIDYAHNRGVLHRDIKPGNIIVGKYGETLVVDWGLAKPLGRVEPGQEGGERTLVLSSTSGSAETLAGSALGTPAYMSPEQAGGELDRLGPRSDVYSLGATLYSVLTGRPPFVSDDIGEVLGEVQRGEFAPPRSLVPALDPALEAICLQAMALRPEDRYATCRALADDVERWMADEPVSAWREPWARRARRWAWRNRTAVTGATAALVVGVIGLSAAAIVQSRANSTLEAKNLQLTAANAATTNAKNKAETALAEMGSAYFELGELTSKVGDKPAALAAHRKGLAVRRELASESVVDADARSAVARSLFSAGLLLIETANSAEAFARFEEARDLLEGLPLSGPGSDERRALLGRIYAGIGFMLESTGKPTAAMATLHRSVDTLTRLADDNPAVTDFRNRLANTLNIIGNLQSNTGKPVELLESYRRSLAIRQKLADDNPSVTDFQNGLADTHNNIGFLQAQTGKPGEALKSYRRAVAIQQTLADDNPAVTDFRSRLASTRNNIGNLQSDTGKPFEALESYGLALAIFQKLVVDNPAFSEFRSRLADSHTNIGWLLVQNGRAAEAVAECSRAVAIQQRLVQENPSVPDYRNRLASCQTNSATALLALGRPAGARALCERAVGLHEALVKDDPETAEYRVRLGESLLRSGQARRDEGDAAGAATDWRRADALLDGPGRWPRTSPLSKLAATPRSRGRLGGRARGCRRTRPPRRWRLLRRAAETGFRNLATYRNETALDPLRGRADFRLLMMDLAFPDDPFAE